MKKKTTVELISESERTALYSISFEMDGTAALQTILKLGALERFFRPEGRMNDSIAAIPIDGGKLRLYCLRISEQIVILGNGGIKKSRTYEEDLKLYGYVLDLQRFENLLKEKVAKGYIRIEERVLNGIEDVVFEI